MWTKCFMWHFSDMDPCVKHHESQTLADIFERCQFSFFCHISVLNSSRSDGNTRDAPASCTVPCIIILIIICILFLQSRLKYQLTSLLYILTVLCVGRRSVTVSGPLGVVVTEGCRHKFSIHLKCIPWYLHHFSGVSAPLSAVGATGSLFLTVAAKRVAWSNTHMGWTQLRVCVAWRSAEVEMTN